MGDENYKVGFFSDLHIGVHQNSEKWHDVTYKWAEWYTSQLREKQITKMNCCVPLWAAAAGEILNRNRNRIFVYLCGPAPLVRF